MKKMSLAFLFLSALAVLMLRIPDASALPSFYTSQNCSACHGATATCNGCHQHGTHSGLGAAINIAGSTNKATYAPGETVTVTITGGWQTGWIRTYLYDQNMTELARSTGTVAVGAIAPSGGPGYPVKLTAPAPATPGTYTWNVSWYGNQYDTIGPYQATCSGTVMTNCWRPSTNPNHGEEIVSINAFTVAGTATAPKISLNPSSLAFGTVTVGSPATLTAQVQNTGNANLVVSGIARCSGTSTEFTWSPSTVPLTVPAGGSTTLSVTYDPAAAATASGCLNLTSNDPAVPTAVLNVSGTGTPVPQPKINLNPASVAFGTVTVGASGTQTTQIQNLGTADLVVSGIARCSGTSAEFSSTTAVPLTVPAGGSALFTLVYAPANSGVDTGCLTIASNDPIAPASTVDVTGTGSAPVQEPQISLNPSSLAFGTVAVGGSVSKTTQIQNTGNADLVVSGIAPCAGTSAEYTSATSVPLTIPAGGNAALSVTYAPVDAGSDTGCMEITSNDPVLTAAQLALTGTGATPPEGAADFDILRFSATHEIELSRDEDGSVRFSLSVANKGPVDGSASARLVGLLNGTKVYDQTVTVSAPAGGTGAFSFPRYRATSRGVIRWTVTIDDPTPDTATATTTVEREDGYSSGSYSRSND